MFLAQSHVSRDKRPILTHFGMLGMPYVNKRTIELTTPDCAKGQKVRGASVSYYDINN